MIVAEMLFLTISEEDKTDYNSDINEKDIRNNWGFFGFADGVIEWVIF